MQERSPDNLVVAQVFIKYLSFVDSTSSLPCSEYTPPLNPFQNHVHPFHCLTPELQSASTTVSHVFAFRISDYHSVYILHLPCACYMHCLATGSTREPVLSKCCSYHR